MTKIIPVILCGGSGTRLWPLSRQKTPKQFLKLMDDKTLLQRTVLRTLEILGCTENEIITVTLCELKEETESQLNSLSPKLSLNMLCEPEARNTAAAVALATRHVLDHFGSDALIWLLPADHHIGNLPALKRAVREAEEFANDNYMVTFGIEPTRAETGYGYIRKSTRLNEQNTWHVKAFHEKPDQATAENFIDSKEYLWSSGMHLFKAETGRDKFIKFAPDTWEKAQKSLEHGKGLVPHKELYAHIKKEPFETAVMEKTDNVAVVACDPEWSDIGCWESLWEIRIKDSHGNSTKGQVFCHDTTNSMVIAQNRLVTCVGLKNVIVIETDDSILVADKKSNSALKILVDRLRETGRKETHSHQTISYAWGSERNIADNRSLQLREVAIFPGMALAKALQNSSSDWLVYAGDGEITINGVTTILRENEVNTVPAGVLYNIRNISDKNDLKLYEIRFYNGDQSVTYNDAHREGPYKRIEPLHSVARN